MPRQKKEFFFFFANSCILYVVDARIFHILLIAPLQNGLGLFLFLWNVLDDAELGYFSTRVFENGFFDCWGWNICTHVVYLVKEEEERLEFDTVERVTMKAWARTTSWAIFTKKFNWNYNVRQACGGLGWNGVVSTLMVEEHVYCFFYTFDLLGLYLFASVVF